MKGKKRIWLIAAIIILVAIGLAAFYNHQAQSRQAGQKPRTSLTDQLNKLSTTDIVSLGLVYTRYEEDDRDYRLVYQKAVDQRLKVKKYRQYRVGSTRIKNHQRPIYYLGQQVTAVIKPARSPKQTLIWMSDRGDEKDAVKLAVMYRFVTRHPKLKQAWLKIKGNLKIAKTFSKQAALAKTNTADNHDNTDLFTVPAGMRGTWYSYDDEGGLETVTFSAHTLTWTASGETGRNILYPATSQQVQESPALQRQHQAAHWCTANPYTLNGINYLQIRSWAQGAGDGTSYGLHTEAGQTVLVQGSGAETWTDGVFWRDKAQAAAHKGKRFADLHYRDDDWDDSETDDENGDSDDDNYDSDDDQANVNDNDETDEDTVDDD